ncbi:hypothetical protein Adt_39034 [Abeliophyllum distichum]|uniref:Uncharacterized protein n=1 Tax=Abeliophyllum distichum TaxID=126358 RepID=A0ABD1Q3X6_9LAMI
MPLPIAFNNVECTIQPIRNNAKYFTRLVGNQVRFTVFLCYPSWTEVPEEHRARLRSIIESYFDLQGDRSPDEYWAICAATDHLATNRYHSYKLKEHNHLKGHGPSRPYGEMSAEDWQKFIDFFTSSIFVGTFPSLDSTTASKAPQGTFHQFSGDPQNDDHRFAMYKAQLRRMQWTIELLKNSISVVVPEEDNNKDTDKSLGDL